MIKAKLNLDVGCGEHCQPGFCGMDIRKVKGVEIIHDAEVFPWPVDDGACSVVLMSHFIEHVKPWLQIDMMNEAWRVLELGGMLLISTPYGGSFRWHQDPTHCASWNEATIEYFVKGKPLYEVYKPKPWAVDRLFFNPRADIEVSFKKIAEEI